MMLDQTTTIINENSTLLDKLLLGGQTLLLGMLAIFAILAIIYAAIKVLGFALNPARKTAKKEAKAEEKASAPVAEPVAAPAPAPAPAPAANDESELVAVLAAAISAYSGEPVTKFRVVSFKHIK